MVLTFGLFEAGNDGVTEWAGWSFADKAWWVETADDQQRSQFELGVGTVAVIVLLDNPGEATTAVITFGMLDAGNDWWWAIDNVEVVGFSVP